MKFLSTIVAFLLATTAVYAQDYTEDDNLMFNHMSLGLNVGTTGVGLDLTMPLGKYVQVRAGANYIPAAGITSKLDYADVRTNGDINSRYQIISCSPDLANDVSVKSTPNFINGKIMFDFYPSPSFPLHITLGTFIGDKKIIQIDNVGGEERTKDMSAYYASNYRSTGYDNVRGVKLGNYTLIPDQTGTIDSWIETSMIRPYAGLGWGKAYSEKGINWMIEAGVIYWNKPKVFSRTTDLSPLDRGEWPVQGATNVIERQEEELSGNQGAILKWFSKTSIYPVINFRLGFNMF